MALFNENEIRNVVKNYGNVKIVDWSVENYSEKMVGYLGDHLRLNVMVESQGKKTMLRFFVKCMPIKDIWKAEYLIEYGYFHKEYVMLSQLFKEMESIRTATASKLRPNLLFIREDLFVFEDVAAMGYKMPHHQETMKYEELISTVETLAKFHAQSLIYEEKKSAELGELYSLWQDYEKFLQEPPASKDWRDTGRNAVIDFLKVYSAHRLKPNFKEDIESIVPKVFKRAIALMKPSSNFRNVVTHLDLWTNNIFIKQLENGKFHSLIVDFQTSLYSPPMMDLTSLLFFNTTKAFRHTFTEEIIDFYYSILSKELASEGIDVDNICTKEELIESYEESVAFGITQAAIIVPLVSMRIEDREELFCTPENRDRVNIVSRSREFIQIAEKDGNYRTRVTELFDDIVERYIYPETNEC